MVVAAAQRKSEPLRSRGLRFLKCPSQLRLQSRARLTNFQKTVEDNRSSTHRRIDGKCTMTKQNSSPRIEARKKSKLRALTLTQVKSLRRWLIRDKRTYDQARAKLREQFGISLSTGTICRFWYTYCQPAAPPTHDRRPRVFLDVFLQSSRPIRVRILENNSRLSFKVGRMRTRGLKISRHSSLARLPATNPKNHDPSRPNL